MDISDFGVASGLLALFVVGTTELVKQAFERNWYAVVVISLSAVVGGLAGWILFPVIGGAVGIALGLSASGLVTSLKKIGTGTN